MSLKRSGMVASTTGTDVLSLTAEANESILIRKISMDLDAAGAENISVTVQRKTIQQFKAPLGWYLLGALKASAGRSIYNALHNAGLLSPIPVASGETLAITAPGTNNSLEVMYDLYDAGDVLSSAYNGSQAGSYDLVQMVSNSAAVAAAGDVPLDQSDLSSVFPAFPGGKTVPATHQITLLALVGSPAYTHNGTTAYQYTRFLKFLKDREDLFDKELQGIPYEPTPADSSSVVAYGHRYGRLFAPTADQDAGIIVFDNPTVFGPGTELNVFATVAEAVGGEDFAAGEIKVGMLFRVEKIG